MHAREDPVDPRSRPRVARASESERCSRGLSQSLHHHFEQSALTRLHVPERAPVEQHSGTLAAVLDRAFPP